MEKGNVITQLLQIFAASYLGVSKSSKSQLPKKQDSEKKSSSGWLSGPDSFWGSFTQSASTSSKDSKQTKEKSFYDDQTNNEPAPDKEKDVPPKESKLSASKAMNLKRNNKKKSLKKKADASESKIYDSQTTKSTQENKAEAKTEKLDDLEGRSNEIKQSKSADLSDTKTGSISNDELASLEPNDELGGENLKPSNYDGLNNKSDNRMKEKENREGATKLGNTVEKIKDVSITDNVEAVTEKEDDRNVQFEEVELTKKPEVKAKDEKLEPLDYDSSDVMEDKPSEITDLQNNEVNDNNGNEHSQKFEVDRVNSFQVNEKLLENKDEESVRQQGQEFVAESIQNLDLLSAAPVAASTPQRKEPSYHKSDKNGQENNDDLSNLNELLMASQNVKEEVVSEPLKKADKDVNVPNEVKKVKYVEGLETNEEVSDSVSKQVGKTLLTKVYHL